jgi:hypothetical protein
MSPSNWREQELEPIAQGEAGAMRAQAVLGDMASGFSAAANKLNRKNPARSAPILARSAQLPRVYDLRLIDKQALIGIGNIKIRPTH